MRRSMAALAGPGQVERGAGLLAAVVTDARSTLAGIRYSESLGALPDSCAAESDKNSILPDNLADKTLFEAHSADMNPPFVW